MFSTKVEAALVFASRRHAGQTRKSSDVPYFIHLVHVALILARHGADDATLIIGLLHDVLEDTTHTEEEWTAVEREIRQTWGDEVAEGVSSLSEPKREASGERLRWRGRKEAYMAQLRSAAPRALRVSAADKVHNLETLIAQLRAQGPELWSSFRAGPKDSLWYYRQVFGLLAERLGADEPLVAELGDAVARLEAVAAPASEDPAQVPR
jgi:(p)ppGpp synthase/HD superfamily hydrolase